MYSTPKPTLKEVTNTNKRLARQLTVASRLIVDYIKSDDRRTVIKKADSLTKSRKQLNQLAGIILLKKITTQPPYNADGLTRFANFMNPHRSEDMKYHLVLAYAEAVKTMADNGFIDMDSKDRAVRSIMENDMHDTLKTHSISPLLRRCAAVRVLGILRTSIFYPSVRELMYHDPYDPNSSEPNLALVDAAASAICDVNIEGAFEELHNAYTYTLDRKDITRLTAESITSIILKTIHTRLALRIDVDEAERGEVFNFLLDSRYFNNGMSSGGTYSSL